MHEFSSPNFTKDKTCHRPWVICHELAGIINSINSGNVLATLPNNDKGMSKTHHLQTFILSDLWHRFVAAWQVHHARIMTALTPISSLVVLSVQAITHADYPDNTSNLPGQLLDLLYALALRRSHRMAAGAHGSAQLTAAASDESHLPSLAQQRLCTSRAALQKLSHRICCKQPTTNAQCNSVDSV